MYQELVWDEIGGGILQNLNEFSFSRMKILSLNQFFGKTEKSVVVALQTKSLW